LRQARAGETAISHLGSDRRGQLIERDIQPLARHLFSSQLVMARGVSEVDRLSCCAFVFMDEAAEDVAAVELPRCG
jgi:hypothetical protein